MPQNRRFPSSLQGTPPPEELLASVCRLNVPDEKLLWYHTAPAKRAESERLLDSDG